MNEFAPSNKMLFTAAIILIVGLITTAAGFFLNLGVLGVVGAGISGASVVLIVRLVIAKYNRDFAKEIIVSQKDERQMQIYVHGGNLAFWLGMFTIIALGIITNTKDPIILFTPAILLLIYLGSVLYYRRKS